MTETLLGQRLRELEKWIILYLSFISTGKTATSPAMSIK